MIVLVPTITLVEDGGAFICTTQLLGVVADLVATALLARMLNEDGGLHVVVVEGLHLGSLRAQGRWEGRWLGVCDNRLGGGI
jgi:hypothetical protein